ncbi:MAG: hypothetical protein V1647_05430 [Pseudomonadota bacterium]
MNTKGIPETHIKTVKDVTVKHVACSQDKMVIIHLNRNQFQRFKPVSKDMMEADPDIKSVYAEFGGKYFHIAGYQSIIEDVNGFPFKVSPFSPLKKHTQSNFYKKVRDISPKGTTRNCIIIGTHFGLIPLHTAHLYNRLYCVDVDKTSYTEGKETLRFNKVNNCMMFNVEPEKWLKDFEAHKYTPPGKIQKIGSSVINLDIVGTDELNTLLNIKPETVILFSESKDKVEKKATMFEKREHESGGIIKSDYLYLVRLKRHIGEAPCKA